MFICMIDIWAFGHTIHYVSMDYCLTGKVRTLLIPTEIVAACSEYFPVYGFMLFPKRCVRLTGEHGQVIRKWLHRTLQQQLH